MNNEITIDNTRIEFEESINLTDREAHTIIKQIAGKEFRDLVTGLQLRLEKDARSLKSTASDAMDWYRHQLRWNGDSRFFLWSLQAAFYTYSNEV